MLKLVDVFQKTGTNKGLWEAFRKQCFLNGVLSGSDYPMMWGYGYETVNSYIRRFKKREYEKPETNMIRNALDWGINNEANVVKILLDNYEVQQCDFNLPTELYAGPGYTTIITPDGIIRNEAGEYSIVEIKCPYYWTLKSREDKLEYTVKKFQSDNPYGSVKYFLQAAYYSTVKNIDSFIVAVHWIDENKSVTGIHEYKNNVSLKSAIMKGIREFVELMEEVKNGTEKSFQVRKKKKDKIVSLMQASFISRCYIKTENTSAPDSGQIHQGKNVEFLSPFEDVK